jgi:hypothetical protein
MGFFTTKLERRMEDIESRLKSPPHNGSPLVSIYRIDNGYLVQTNRTEFMSSSYRYCANTQDIADHLATIVAKNKIGVGSKEPEQLDLFEAETYTTTKPKIFVSR